MSKPTRFPFGIALGFENQFNNYGKGGRSVFDSTTQYEQTTAGLLAQMSTAPDVSQGSLFYTNNTGATTIVNLYHYQPGRAGALTASGQVDLTSPLPEGKIITLFFLDTNTQLSPAGNIVLAGTNNLIGANNVIQLLASRNNWYETNRSYNNTSEVTTFVTNAQSSLNMNGVRYAVVNNTGSTTNKIIGLSGGQIGQEVTFTNIGSNPVMFIFQAGGVESSNMVSIASNSMLVNASGAYKFIKSTDSLWRALVIGSANYGA